MAFGARVLKTGIGVTLALYISIWLNFTSPVIAAIAAIFAMQPSIYRSWRNLLEQLQSNTLGAIIAMLAGMYLSKEPIAIGIVCILVIMLCLKLKMDDAVGLTLVTVIAVMEGSGQWDFALNRFLMILIGIGCAFLINIFFLPPKPSVQFIEHTDSVFAKLSLLLRTAISDEMKESVFRDEKKELEGALKSLSGKYNLFEEEMKQLRKHSFSQFRHLVVYKQILGTLNKGIEVLDAIEQHYFQTFRNSDTDEWFDRHLEKLLKFHEHVLLKFEGKLKNEADDAGRMEADNDLFMHTFTEIFVDRRDDMLRLSIVAAVIYDYGYQIGRLNKLVEQYNKGTDDKEELATVG